MTDNSQTHDRTEIDDCIASTDAGRGGSYRPSRRRLLESLTVGGSVLLTGCGQMNAPDSNPTETGTSATTGQAVDQTFRAPIRGNIPKKTSFFFGGMTMHGGGPIQNQAYAPLVKEPASWTMRRFLRESGAWVSGGLAPSPETQINYNWIEEPMTITPKEVTLKIRDDAKWSDGHPVKGKDLAYLPLRRSLEGWGGASPVCAGGERETPTCGVRIRRVPRPGQVRHLREFIGLLFGVLGYLHCVLVGLADIPDLRAHPRRTV